MASRLSIFVVILIAMALQAPGAFAAGLCQYEGWQCAALTAIVGGRRVSSIHDPTHRDDRILDGGIADISVKAGSLLTLTWQGQADKEIKQKPRVRVDVISNKPAPSGCKEPEWADETLSGSSDVDLDACQEGRNFVVTYRVEQGKEQGAFKVARVRVHVLGKDASIDPNNDHNAVSFQTQTGSEPITSEEADFTKLQSY
jgi:hypothetical protein